MNYTEPQPSDLQTTLQESTLLYQLHAGKTQSIINFQHSYVTYLVLILLLVVLLYVLYKVKKIMRMRQLKHKFVSLIDFIDGIKYHLDQPPICSEAHRYTKTDGLTLVYYYQYPHSFGNPFRNRNFPVAVVLSYYSQVTNSSSENTGGCFSQWGDRVQMMLSYSELNVNADAATIICQSGWVQVTDEATCAAPEGCTNFCCPVELCASFCQPFYEESIADIVTGATLDAAGAGVIVGTTLKGGQQAYVHLTKETVKTQTDTAKTGVEALQEASKPIGEIEVEGVVEAAPEITGEVAGATTIGGTESTAVVAAGEATSETATEGTATVGTFLGIETASDAVPVVGTAIGVAVAIGFGIFMGLQSRKERKQQCMQYQQNCIPTDDSGEC